MLKNNGIEKILLSDIVARVSNRAKERQTAQGFRSRRIIRTETHPTASRQKLPGSDVWRGRKVAVFQPLHADIPAAAVFWKIIQIGHEDEQASFRSHVSVAVH